jgi:hypothetical protein
MKKQKAASAEHAKAQKDLIEQMCLKMVDEGILVVKGKRDGRIVFARAASAASAPA